MFTLRCFMFVYGLLLGNLCFASVDERETLMNQIKLQAQELRVSLSDRSKINCGSDAETEAMLIERMHRESSGRELKVYSHLHYFLEFNRYTLAELFLSQCIETSRHVSSTHSLAQYKKILTAIRSISRTEINDETCIEDDFSHLHYSELGDFFREFLNFQDCLNQLMISCPMNCTYESLLHSIEEKKSVCPSLCNFDREIHLISGISIHNKDVLLKDLKKFQDRSNIILAGTQLSKNHNLTSDCLGLSLIHHRQTQLFYGNLFPYKAEILKKTGYRSLWRFLAR